jgi:hypothetical protein
MRGVFFGGLLSSFCCCFCFCVLSVFCLLCHRICHICIRFRHMSILHASSWISLPCLFWLALLQHFRLLLHIISPVHLISSFSPLPSGGSQSEQILATDTCWPSLRSISKSCARCAWAHTSARARVCVWVQQPMTPIIKAPPKNREYVKKSKLFFTVDLSSIFSFAVFQGMCEKSWSHIFCIFSIC